MSSARWRCRRRTTVFFEEQFDVPTILVVLRNDASGRAKVIACQYQRCGRVRAINRDATQGGGVAIAPLAAGCRVGEMHDLVRQNRVAILSWYRACSLHGQGCIALEAGDENGALGVDLGPLVVVAIALVEDVGGTGDDIEVQRFGHIVDIGCRETVLDGSLLS